MKTAKLVIVFLVICVFYIISRVLFCIFAFTALGIYWAIFESEDFLDSAGDSIKERYRALSSALSNYREK